MLGSIYNGDIKPIKENDKVVAAKVIVYPGDTEEYHTFITHEAYNELKKWIEYRSNEGGEINEKSWVILKN